jgi:hypothetical protein
VQRSDEYLISNIISAGIEIQEDLPELLGPEAAGVRQQLDSLLRGDRRNRRRVIARSIYALLKSHPPTYGWLVAYLRFTTSEGGPGPTEGDPGPIELDVRLGYQTILPPATPEDPRESESGPQANKRGRRRLLGP